MDRIDKLNILNRDFDDNDNYKNKNSNAPSSSSSSSSSSSPLNDSQKPCAIGILFSGGIDSVWIYMIIVLYHMEMI